MGWGSWALFDKPVMLSLIAPWIVDAWHDVFLALSFDIPRLALDRISSHLLVASIALLLLAATFLSTHRMPRGPRLVALSLALATLMGPFAVLTAVHLDNLERLPPFAGRVRKPLEKPEPSIATQRLPDQVALAPSPAKPRLELAVNPLVLAPNPVPPSITATEATTPPEKPSRPISPTQAAQRTMAAATARVMTNMRAIFTSPAHSPPQGTAIFFATDRAATAGSAHRFGKESGGELLFGRALVDLRIPPAPPPPTPISPVSLAASDSLKPKAALTQFSLKEVAALTSDTFTPALTQHAGRQQARARVLIFVPGHNIGFEAALYRAGQIASRTQFAGPVIVYSWPSDGTTADYRGDQLRLTASRAHFTTFLRVVLGAFPAQSIALVSLGLGSKLALDGLSEIATDSAQHHPAIAHHFLLAPDVAIHDLERASGSLGSIVTHTTLYVASNDRGLNISRRYWGGVPRAGDMPGGVPLVMRGIDTIDASLAGTLDIGLNHPALVQPDGILRDLARRLAEPPDTRGMPSAPADLVTTSAGPYTRLR